MLLHLEATDNISDNISVFFKGSCLLLAAKFNDDLKAEKIKDLIEVRYLTVKSHQFHNHAQ